MYSNITTCNEINHRLARYQSDIHELKQRVENLNKQFRQQKLFSIIKILIYSNEQTMINEIL